ncbi:hypothetical protein EV421DRAFT_1903287 [Armillaria borealis]|uniref:Uncharacterized protein n=1 Tax=Armillaria borealis TaxID=47425 RepID=A0AA39JLZ3_9AGAR|nr:hypothetical protein EV421DRAFT_1903287 [Armillaria borealis]
MSLSHAASALNTDVWHVVVDSTGNEKAFCHVCHDSLGRDIRNARPHEQSDHHQRLLAQQQQISASLTSSLLAAALHSTDSALHGEQPTSPAVPICTHFDVAGTNLLYSFLPPDDRPEMLSLPDTTPVPIADYLNNYWKGVKASGEATTESPQRVGAGLITQAIVDLMEQGPDSIPSDDEGDECSDVDDAIEPEDEDVLEHSHKRRCTRAQDIFDSDNDWFPWPDRISCTLDIFMHLPRSAFSQHQLDLFLWLLEANKVDDLPSVASMKKLNKALQKLCGIESLRYEGALGHKYYLNSLSQMIAQEMANPEVRQLLEFYPEDAGEHLSEARQASHWLNEAPDDQLTPMFRTWRGDDYYIHELAMLHDGTVCMPYRWFRQGRKHYACCWHMQTYMGEHHSAWHVVKVTGYEVLEDDLLKNFPELCIDTERVYNLPHLPAIAGICEDVQRPEILTAWTLTDLVKGNRWRERVEGCRVLTFPIWLYCDDTSGNVLKKWNKHNSFLFMPAGLPRSESQKDYNVHFLCTSNIALPLEMLDGIVKQLEEGQEHGIWAWDCHLNEAVLIIPMVLAMLGDNPMQSDVKGKDANESRPSGYTANVPDDVLHDGDVDSGSDDERIADNDGSDDGHAAQGTKTKGRRKLFETFDAMKHCVTDFMKINTPRTKAESMEKLRSQFAEDTFASFLIDKLINSYKRKRGDQRQEALDKAIEEMHEEILSPVWRIKGLDLHSDTPVEILHVVLLGFVKYMWWDVVHNQLHKNEKRCQLMVRLASVDVEGMGLPPLAGHTLVTYCGSLTGRDFRAVAQVTPFILKDFVEDDCYQTWLALSKLVPLIWQPEIDNLEAYITLLQKEIDYFLHCMAQWTCRWFNKPKFHILVHLPEHIRHFGPAMLLLPRRLSLSMQLFDQKCNRVQHLFSRGLFLLRDHVDVKHALTPQKKDMLRPTPSATCQAPFSKDKRMWVRLGRSALAIVATPSAATDYLRLTDKKKDSNKWGTYTSDGKRARPFAETQTGLHAPSLFGSEDGTPLNPLCKTGKDVYLLSHDLCRLGGHVVIRGADNNYIVTVEEILHKSVLFGDQVDYILVKSVSLGPASVHSMPRISRMNTYSVVQLADVLCTVNVQHDCISNHCQAEKVIPLLQEDQIVLNTAQMRSAKHIQPFRVPSIPMDATEVILASSSDTINVTPFHYTSHATTNWEASQPHGVFIPPPVSTYTHSAIPAAYPSHPQPQYQALFSANQPRLPFSTPSTGYPIPWTSMSNSLHQQMTETHVGDAHHIYRPHAVYSSVTLSHQAGRPPSAWSENDESVPNWDPHDPPAWGDPS